MFGFVMALVLLSMIVGLRSDLDISEVVGSRDLCDVIFALGGSNDTQQLEELLVTSEINLRAVVLITSVLTPQEIDTGICQFLIVDATTQEYFLDVVKRLSHTRSPTLLISVGNSEEVVNNLYRANFEAYVFENAKDEVNTHYLPRKDMRWLSVNVTYRPRDYWLLKGAHGKYQGPDYAVLRELQLRKGLSYNFSIAKSFNDMIIRVGDGRADMAISHASFSHARYNLAGDISAPYGGRTFAMVTRRPPKIQAKWTLLYPFNIPIWATLLASVLALAGCFLLGHLLLMDEKMIDLFQIFSISTITLINEALPQSWFKFRQHSRTGFVMLLLWFPLSLVLTNAYKSNLLSSLISADEEEAVNTWHGLLDKKMRFMLHPGLIMTFLMRDSPREVVRQVYQECVQGRNGYTKIIPKVPPNVTRLILEGKAGYMDDTQYQAGLSHLFMVGEELIYTPLGAHLTWRFPWKDDLNQVVESLTSGGIIRKIHFDVAYKHEKAERDYLRTQPDPGGPLTTIHLTLTWIVLGIGLSAALLVFLLETARCGSFMRTVLLNVVA